MLAYSFSVLNEQGYKKMDIEEFHHVSELLAAILIKGTSSQIKRGLGREYLTTKDVLPSLRGKIDLTESIKNQYMQKKQLACEYDHFSVNSYMNKILKTTMKVLIKTDISKSQKKELKKLLVYFKDVDTLNPYMINWKISHNRNNKTYEMLISICYLVIRGLLQSNVDGDTRLREFIDEKNMSRLYEKFIFNYYRKEHPNIKTNAPHITWQLDSAENNLLPLMKTDIVLSKNNDVLIIDAKYYSKTTQINYGVNTLHSGNLYQIFTYVKNKEASLGDESQTISGMLLYAKTDEEVVPNNTYSMSGNQISVLTLDLSGDFIDIANQLDYIVINHLKTGEVMD